MEKKRRRSGALRALLQVLWQQPLWAVPFALFFALVFGRIPESLPATYLISLIFSALTGLTIWAIRWFVLRDYPSSGDWKKPTLFYGGGAVGASLVAALIVDRTLLPGFLTGSGRNFAVVISFALLFCALFMGIGIAISFYQDSLARARADQELSLARRIQRSFLLSQFPQRPRLELHAVNWSSREVSGDFYDVVPIGDEGLLIAVADVSGKGVPAALLSSMLQASLRTQAGGERSVAEIMRRINVLVCQRAETGQFATVFLAWIDERTLRLRYTNAGHNFPVLLGRGGRRLLDRGGTVVGIMESLTWAEEEIALEPGDRLVLYTDGVSEAANGTGEMYGEERLYALLDSTNHDVSAPGMVERVLDDLRRFLGETEPGDDVTVLAMRVRQPSADGAAAPASAAPVTAASIGPPA